MKYSDPNSATLLEANPLRLSDPDQILREATEFTRLAGRLTKVMRGVKPMPPSTERGEIIANLTHCVFAGRRSAHVKMEDDAFTALGIILGMPAKTEAQRGELAKVMHKEMMSAFDELT